MEVFANLENIFLNVILKIIVTKRGFIEIGTLAR